MTDPAGFSYRPPNATARESSGLPYLPIVLTHQGNSAAVNGLLDTGATVNVLPFALGQHLGLVWEDQPLISRLAGNLAAFECRGVQLTGIVEPFALIRLKFAWTKNETVPLILGQVNFFRVFQVCFDGADQVFTIVPKS